MWRDPVSNEVMPAMWHPKGYGGTGLTDAGVSCCSFWMPCH